MASANRCHPDDKAAILKFKNSFSNGPQLDQRLRLCACLRFLQSLRSSVMFINLSFNNVSGLIPSSLATLPNLIALDLNRNRLTGSIPDSFGHIIVSQDSQGLSLSLSHNMLTGEIPTSLLGIQTSIGLMYQGTTCQETLQCCLVHRSLDISRNNFEFDLSGVSFMTNELVELDISHDKIYGKIP
ncbi:polygalacturonase inhibitor [Lactuca sativa]|nr:polygalacturonase inhibitor [Lactuca sativa]